MSRPEDLTPEVIGNDWQSLLPEHDARWTPSRTVSICIPTRNPGAGLRRTLHCLAAQTYPLDLIEVVICDDGSDDPIELEHDAPFRCRIVRQERTLAFGAGRARNSAARGATGDILVFLDADVIPERQVVEAYARWFDRSKLVVPMGLCRFVDVDDMDDDQLFDLVHRGEMATTFAGRDVDDQEWRERHFGRMDDLRIEGPDAFRVTIGATIAVGAEQFAAIGGFRELGVRGVEDTEFGYRLHRNGGILILDRAARHWHQGRRNLTSDRRAEIDRIRAPYLEALLPVRGFRGADPCEPSPVEVVPVVRAHVAAGDAAERRVALSALRSHESRDLAASDECLPSSEFDPAAFHLVLPPGVVTTPETVRLLRAEARRRDVGVIRAIVEPAESDSGEPMECLVISTRAWRRAVQVSSSHAGFDELVGAAASRFGVWWTDGSTIGVRAAIDVVDDAEVASSNNSMFRRQAARFRRFRRRLLSRSFDAVVDLLKRWS